MSSFGTQGTFFIGCNYLASHAGARMWADWKPEVVRQDLERLSKAGLRVLRVFPIWPDFQPITLLRTYEGRPAEYRIGEEALADDALGRAGLSMSAISHFEAFAAMAENLGLQLIVSLLTGWMSGRLFVPPALAGLNLHTDPMAMMWEIRFVIGFVSHFKDSTAIVAWDLGNECDCLARAPSAEAAWQWTSSIANAIRSADHSRPVISGMHGMTTDGTWTIQDQGELTDFLTTHPYPLFTPHCDQDPINTVRNEVHAAAESVYYRGVGGKPCLVEEAGSLGPMLASEEMEAEFARVSILTAWAHDCRGYLWWCAFESSHLPFAPYDWKAFEGELGVFRRDGTAKPIVQQMTQLQRFIDAFPGGVLPGRIVDGVCILTSRQDAWGAAFSAFILAKQSGLDLEFQLASQPIRDADLYIMPCIRGAESISHRRMQELLARVRAGAVLYVSLDGGLLGAFNELSGMKVLSREKCAGPETLVSTDGLTRLPVNGTYRLNMEPVTAEVLGADSTGRPALTCAAYGQGWILFLDYPLETYLAGKPGAFSGEAAHPYHSVYRLLKDKAKTAKTVTAEAPHWGITEHIVDEQERIIVVLNYAPEVSAGILRIEPGWETAGNLYGSGGLGSGGAGAITFELGRNEGWVFVIKPMRA